MASALAVVKLGSTFKLLEGVTTSYLVSDLTARSGYSFEI